LNVLTFRNYIKQILKRTSRWKLRPITQSVTSNNKYGEFSELIYSNANLKRTERIQ